MNKLVVIVSVTAFLCYGVQSFDISERQLREKVINSGIAIFIDFLEKVKNVTEKIVRDEEFQKSRIAVQTHVKELSKTLKELKAIDKEKAKKNPDLLLQYVMLSYSAGFKSGRLIRESFDTFVHPYMNVYVETFSTKTVAGIWREVESDYLKGAPLIYNKPMDFLSYLLAKAVVKSGFVNVLKSGVNIALEVGKIDLNHLHEELQLLMNHVGEKAAEISSLERQKEKNHLLVSLRTASGVIVFYWDQLLEHTESLSFNEKYSDSMTRWVELTKLKNSSETYHVLIDPKTRHEIMNWTEKTFSKSVEAVVLKYYTYGNEVFGQDRFNQSNWAIPKLASVYGLPVYEKLTESGFGISELNGLLHRMNDVIIIIEGHYLWYTRMTRTEKFIRDILKELTKVVEGEKRRGIYDETMLPIEVIKRAVLGSWDIFLWFSPHKNHKYQQSERDWNHMRTIFINELIQSGEFTEEQLEDAQMNLFNVSRSKLEKVMKHIDMAEGFDKRIDATIETFKAAMHYMYMQLCRLLDGVVE